jgi:nicotinamide mononucleotide transporter
MKRFLESVVVGGALTWLSILITNYFNLSMEQSWLEISAVALSFSCTYLCVFQSRWNYPVGILGVGVYSWLFFQGGLPGVALFNLYLVGSLIYGWYRWGPDAVTRPVTTLSTWQDYLNYAVLGVVVGSTLIVMSFVFNFELTLLDLVVASLSGVAQFLLDNKRRETWIVWAVVNVFSIWLYWSIGLFLVVLQYLFFLGNTAWGWYSWGRK